MFKFLKKTEETKAEAAAGSSKPGLIGLDIGYHTIHLCQLRSKSDGGYSILAKASIPFDQSREALLQNPSRLKRMINNALKSKPFRGRKVIALMPWSEVKIILLTYKSTAVDVDSEIIKMVAKRIDGDIDDYVIDYLPVRSNPTDEEHMAAVSIVSKDKVMSLLRILNQCGLEVDALDIAPAALRRLVGTLYDSGDDNILLINTGADKSFLTIVSGRRLLYYQVIDFGQTRMLEMVAAELDISQDATLELINANGIGKTVQAFARLDNQGEISATLAEILKPCFLELIEEINRVLIFTASETHGAPLSRVCLLGSIAHWNGVEAMLMSMMNIDISADSTDFWRVFQDENDQTTISWSSLFPELAIATGLALRGIIDYE